MCSSPRFLIFFCSIISKTEHKKFILMSSLLQKNLELRVINLDKIPPTQFRLHIQLWLSFSGFSSNSLKYSSLDNNEDNNDNNACIGIVVMMRFKTKRK